MSTITVMTKAVHLLNGNRTFAASVSAINLDDNTNIVTREIPEEGGSLDLETGARYKIVASPRSQDNFQNGAREEVMITDTTQEVIVFIPPMGEECRMWLEDIKRMLANGDYQTAKQNILIAKDVYRQLIVFPEEVTMILELEREIPDHIY